jgi:cysteinyl-tRNA synthetase
LSSQADAFVDLLVEVRTDLREENQWALSDKIRDQLSDLSVSLEDGKGGTTWRWK